MSVSAHSKTQQSMLARLRGALNAHPRVVIAAGLATIALDLTSITSAFGA